MICPLMSFNPGNHIYKESLADCVKDKCAWWDREYNMCVIIGIKIELLKIGDANARGTVKEQPVERTRRPKAKTTLRKV